VRDQKADDVMAVILLAGEIRCSAQERLGSLVKSRSGYK
jgi:hypothetical protein